MEGGVDVEETNSLDAAQDGNNHDAQSHEEPGEDNKFQTAIGAWRSTAN